MTISVIVKQSWHSATLISFAGFVTPAIRYAAFAASWVERNEVNDHEGSNCVFQ